MYSLGIIRGGNNEKMEYRHNGDYAYFCFMYL
jgi:hypothetical protein